MGGGAGREAGGVGGCGGGRGEGRVGGWGGVPHAPGDHFKPVPEIWWGESRGTSWVALSAAGSSLQLESTLEAYKVATISTHGAPRRS